MSSDLRTLLHEAAPRPAAGFDERRIERRARRITLVRVAAGVLAAATVAGGATVITARRPAPDGIVGDVRPQPAPPQPEVDARQHERPIPPGPRYELASGVFGDDWDHEAGKAWKLLAWGRPRRSCWQVAVEGEARNSNMGCTHGRTAAEAAVEIFAGTSSVETGSRDPDEFAFMSGEVGPRVQRLEFRSDRGPRFSVPLYSPPRKTGIVHRYFAVVLPRYDYGRLDAIAEDGEVLASRDLCGVACRAAHEREREVEVLSYEHTPVTTESAAAAFAVEAAARAGLMNRLGTVWSYRTISSDELVASFRTTECAGSTLDGTYECDPEQDAASIDVGIEDDRFVVEAVEGAATEEQRAAVEAHSAAVTDDVREWRQVAHSFAHARGDEWEVAVVAVWTGNLDAPRDYGSACRLVFYDAAGRVLERSRPLPFGVRPEEYHRVNALTTSIVTERPPADLALDCAEPGPDVSESW